jgi:predicted Zn-dependent protease
VEEIMISSFIAMRRYAFVLALLLCFSNSPRISLAQDPLLDLLADELSRETAVLKTQETPPYFISFSVSDVHTTNVSASFGTITNSDENDERLLSVMVRVGDYRLDNTRQLRGDPFSDFTFHVAGFVRMAREPNPEAIRAVLWQETNAEYRKAVERYVKVKANVAVKVAAEDTSADFSQESKVADYEPPVDVKGLLRDRSLWENKVKKYSALLLKNKDVYGGQAWFSFTVERKNLVTTEGAKLAQNLIYSRLFVSGFIKADDGMELPLYLSYFAFKPGDLPKDEVIVADVEGMIKKLETLRNAPAVDPYTGPAILSGRAAGVFFHEIFGHRIEGHRQKSEEEGQTFKKKIGEKILPETMNVIFDPTVKNYAGRELVGFYKYDDEGVPARRVPVVENGTFKSFLMSRSPVEGFPHSNGHGRAQAGFRSVARQSNLIVESKMPVPESELRRVLIEECKKQNKPFGLLFADIQGGFTFTGRTIPNAFNVLPTEVYRVYTDGRPDELVRGVDWVGTPLVMFSMVSHAGDKFDLFNGVCGAESGGVPVSAVAPALLVSQVEVQKKSKSQERPPILPRPDTEPTM